jgi:hypothetical protein
MADCESFRMIFEKLNDLKSRTPVLYVSKYEEMVSDFNDWLDRLSDFTRCNNLLDLKNRIQAHAKFDVKEDKFNHKRQVSPGDFRRKLSPQTQRALTKRLAPVLQNFGYSCDL